MLYNHLILCHPLFLLPSIFPSAKSFAMSQLFTSGGQIIGAPAFNICLSNEYSGLISFRINWFDLQAVQGTLKHLLQHHNLKALVLQLSVFFMVQLSLPYMTTGKTIALTILNFFLAVMSLLFNTLFMLVIAFLPKSKWSLISWLQSPLAEFWSPPKIKSVTLSIVSSSICHEVMGPYTLILVYNVEF